MREIYLQPDGGLASGNIIGGQRRAFCCFMLQNKDVNIYDGLQRMFKNTETEAHMFFFVNLSKPFKIVLCRPPMMIMQDKQRNVWFLF